MPPGPTEHNSDWLTRKRRIGRRLMLVTFRPKADLTSLFLYYSLREGSEVLRIKNEYRGSAGQVNIPLSQARNFVVKAPPVDEQYEIIRRVNMRMELADIIERRVAAATARADRLTQAILAKAFRGELVPTEAELARQDGRDYEPASVLLERARVARAAAADGSKRSTRSRLAEPRKRSRSVKGPDQENS